MSMSIVTAATLPAYRETGGNLPVTTSNFLIAFKFLTISNALKLVDGKLREQTLRNHRFCVRQLEQILGFEFFCGRKRKVYWRDDERLLTKLGKALNEVGRENYTVKYIQWQHGQLEEIVLKRLSFSDKILFSWPKSDFGHFVLDDAQALGWQQLDSCYLWIWIHVLAFHVCCNGVIVDQFCLLNTISYWIECAGCYTHYLENLTAMNTLVSSYKENVYFILLHLHEKLRKTAPMKDFDSRETTTLNEDGMTPLPKPLPLIPVQEKQQQQQQQQEHVQPPPLRTTLSEETLAYDIRYRRLYMTLYAMYRNVRSPVQDLHKYTGLYWERYRDLDSQSDGDEQDATGLTEDDYTDDNYNDEEDNVDDNNNNNNNNTIDKILESTKSKSKKPKSRRPK